MGQRNVLNHGGCRGDCGGQMAEFPLAMILEPNFVFLISPTIVPLQTDSALCNVSKIAAHAQQAQHPTGRVCPTGLLHHFHLTKELKKLCWLPDTCRTILRPVLPDIAVQYSVLLGDCGAAAADPGQGPDLPQALGSCGPLGYGRRGDHSGLPLGSALRRPFRPHRRPGKVRAPCPH